MGTIESVQAAVPWKKRKKKLSTTHAKRGTKKRRRSSLVSSGHCGAAVGLGFVGYMLQTPWQLRGFSWMSRSVGGGRTDFEENPDFGGNFLTQKGKGG